jgi:hypothetical protein
MTGQRLGSVIVAESEPASRPVFLPLPSGEQIYE